MSDYYIKQFIKENSNCINKLEKMAIKQRNKKYRKRKVLVFKEKVASFFIWFTQFMTYIMAPTLIIVAILSSNFTLINALSIYILGLVPTIAININLLRSIIKGIERDSKIESLERIIGIRRSLNNCLVNSNAKDLKIIRDNLAYILKMLGNANLKIDNSFLLVQDKRAIKGQGIDTRILAFLDYKLLKITDNIVKCSSVESVYEEQQLYNFIGEIYQKEEEKEIVKRLVRNSNKH